MDTYRILRNGNALFAIELEESLFEKVTAEAAELDMDVTDYIRLRINQLLEGSDYVLS